MEEVVQSMDCSYCDGACLDWTPRQGGGGDGGGEAISREVKVETGTRGTREGR